MPGTVILKTGLVAMLLAVVSAAISMAFGHTSEAYAIGVGVGAAALFGGAARKSVRIQTPDLTVVANTAEEAGTVLRAYHDEQLRRWKEGKKADRLVRLWEEEWDAEDRAYEKFK